MYKGTKGIAIIVSFLMLTVSSTATFAQGPKGPKPKNFRAGAVYVLTNQVNNQVAVFRTTKKGTAKGTLTFADTFSTGGEGEPTPQGTDPATDPLASQGALIIGPGNRFLFAVNAGSDEISVLRIKKKTLDLVALVDSGGVRPISLALHDDLLYVLNEGGTPHINGFTIGDHGELTPLPGSLRLLNGGAGADYAQIGFSSDGELLVVTDKTGNRIITYTIDEDGLPSAPISKPSNGMTPFGFAFNNSGTLVVSEASGGGASSYNAPDSGILSVVSGSVANSQTAPCWVVIPNNGKFAFVSNTGSGTISSYRIGTDVESLTLVNSVAGTTGMGSAPIDMTLSNNSKFLYVIAGGGGSRSVVSFSVNKDGTLTMIDTDGGLPLGAQGIAAK